jgi:hypothetical protein
MELKTFLAKLDAGEPISREELADWVRSFFSLGFANAAPDDDFCNGHGFCIELMLRTLASPDGELQVEDAPGEMAQLQSVKAFIDGRIKEVQEQIKKQESLAFIEKHGITKDMVHDFSGDKELDGMHDNDKIHQYLCQTTTKPWFNYEGHLFETSMIRNGKSIWDHGFHSRYQELAN